MNNHKCHNDLQNESRRWLSHRYRINRVFYLGQKGKIVSDVNDKKVHVVYLFLDIEWNQAPDTTGLEGREPIQIGAVAADATMQKVKSFSKAIQLKLPELLNEETMKICHTTASNIMQGRPENIVLTNFAQTFPEYQYIVVWDRETYELFERDMKEYKIPMQRHQVIVLQEVASTVVGAGNLIIEFETALISAGIDYISNYLHYSKHDADYLYQLFYICHQQFILSKEDYSRKRQNICCYQLHYLKRMNYLIYWMELNIN